MDAIERKRLSLASPTGAVEQFLPTLRAESTARSYELDLKAFFEWCAAADLQPLLIEVHDLNRFIEAIDARRDLTPNTKARYLTSLKSFFAYLKSIGLRTVSPFDEFGVRPLQDAPGERGPVQTLNFDSFRRFCEVGLGHEDPLVRCTVGLMALNGLKVSEIGALHVADVEAEEGETVRLRLPMRGEEAWTPLVRPLNEDLTQAARDGRDPSEPLLFNRAGNRLTQSNLARIVNRVSEQADIRETVSPSLLRQTAGVIAAEEGARSGDLCDMLGLDPTSVQRYIAPATGPRGPHPVQLVARRLRPGTAEHELLDQVDRLLHEQDVVTLAPAVLAGAALEQHLRQMCVDEGIGDEIVNPNINAYKNELVRSGRLPGPLAEQRIGWWRTLRNRAAHGDPVSRHDAQEMAQGVRRFVVRGEL